MKGPVVSSLLLVILLAGPAAGRESKSAISDFKRCFAPEMNDRTRRKAVESLVAVGEKEILDAFDWGFSQTAGEVRRLVVAKDEALEVLLQLEKEILEIQRRAQERGQEPRVLETTLAAYERARLAVENLQKAIDREHEMRGVLADALGPWLSALPVEERADAFKQLERKHLLDRDWAARVFFVRGLSTAAGNEATRLLLVRLTEEKDRRVLPVVIDALAAQAGAKAVPDLVPLLSDARWQIRASVIGALARIRSPEAVQPLIDRLRAEPGRLRGDIVAALEEITGQELGISPDRWQEWWDAHREGFVPPAEPEPPEEDAGEEGPKDEPKLKPGPAGQDPDHPRAPGEREPPDADDPEAPPPPPPPPPDEGGGVSFYGIRVLSKRIIFVIDISGSMNEPASERDPDRTKIAVAKHELKNAVLGLPDDAHLNIVLYNESVTVWKKGMVRADRKERRAAVDFVEKQVAVGATNIHDALQQAFNVVGLGARDKNYELGADTIFFLSDGEPTVGTIVDPAQIAREVERWNEARRVKIHTVGVGADHDSEFMRRLAESSGGTYVRR